jgi:hypothetical protein
MYFPLQVTLSFTLVGSRYLNTAQLWVHGHLKTIARRVYCTLPEWQRRRRDLPELSRARSEEFAA